MKIKGKNFHFNSSYSLSQGLKPVMNEFFKIVKKAYIDRDFAMIGSSKIIFAKEICDKPCIVFMLICDSLHDITYNAYLTDYEDKPYAYQALREMLTHYPQDKYYEHIENVLNNYTGILKNQLFTIRQHKFLDSLHKPIDVSALIDCINTLKKWQVISTTVDADSDVDYSIKIAYKEKLAVADFSIKNNRVIDINVDKTDSYIEHVYSFNQAVNQISLNRKFDDDLIELFKKFKSYLAVLSQN